MELSQEEYLCNQALFSINGGENNRTLISERMGIDAP